MSNETPPFETKPSGLQVETLNCGEANPHSLNAFRLPVRIHDEDREEEIITSEYVIIQGVKIQPAKLQFTNTFEGKQFQQTVTIQNCGPNLALIRYDGPINKAFSFKSLKCGKRLSSGMKLTIHVSYTYTKHSALSTYNIPIFINEEMFPLKVLVSTPFANVSVHPTHIDFGLIDIGYNVARRRVVLKNVGSKHCKFNIDVGIHDVQLSIEPMKGVVPPYSETTVNVEVTSLEEGDFQASFVVQCIRRIRVLVSGTVTMGKLEVCNIPSCDDFTLIEFPRTYYETRCTRQLVLRNNSASRTVFCVLFSNNDGPEVKDNKCFYINPMDGRLEPQEARIFTIEYRPKLKNKDETYHFADVTIKKLNFWKDINVSDYPKGLYETLRQYKIAEKLNKKNFSFINSLNESIKARSFSNIRSNCSYVSIQELLLDQPQIELEYCIQVYLHGEPEKVDVTCTPDAIDILDLSLNHPVDRVVTIKNNSQHLGVKFAYEKVTYIDVVPKSSALRPNSSIEAKITINVCKLGKIYTNVLLVLFYNNDHDATVQVGKIVVPITLEAIYKTKRGRVNINTGITPTYIKEVGRNADLVPYNDMEIFIPRQTIDPVMRKLRKNDTAFIAFPNDRPRSLRPWTRTSNEMVTVYAKIPRGIVNSNSLCNIKNKLAIWNQTTAYYSHYLKHSRMDLLKVLNNNDLPEYEVSRVKRFLIYRYFTDFVRDKSLVTSNNAVKAAFIPLTPLQLNGIRIEPVHIGVGLIAPYSKTSNSFTITNENEVSIRVYIIPEKQRFTFPQGEGIIVKARASKKVDFVFFSEYEGIYSVCIRLVINECHIFEVLVYANVTQKRLTILDQHVLFKAKDPCIKFINLFNPLNVHVNFLWLPTDSNFSIEPMEGKIPPMKGMACMLTYDPLKNKSDDAELIFQTSPTHKQRCTVKAVPPEITTSLCEMDIDFGLVPMNIKIQKQAVLWNLSNCTISFFIRKPATCYEMKIVPESGFLKKKTSQIFTFTLKSLNCIPFSHKVVIEVNGKPTHEMIVHGSVIFPVVKYSPNPCKLKRFPVTSFFNFCTNIENKTKAPIVLAFDFQQRMDCIITDSKDGERFVKGRVTIAAKQTKSIHIRFDPKDVTSSWFNMPFVLNNLLGSPRSSLAMASETDTSIIKAPTHAVNPNVSVMKVFAIVTESDFYVSRYVFDLYYHPYNVTKTNCEQSTTFTNTSEKELEFCIRLETVSLPFRVSYESGNAIQKHPASITFTLQPKDYTSVMVRFEHKEIGSFYNTAAFYVRNDYQEGIHNYLYLHAAYELPIIPVPKTIYFEYIPLRFTFDKSLFIYNKNHSPVCILKAELEHDSLEILIRQEYCTDNAQKYEICLSYTSHYAESFNTTVVFTCSCGGTAKMNCIGVSENSLFTTFKSIIKSTTDAIVLSQSQSGQSETIHLDEMTSHIVANESNTFPYFPEIDDMNYDVLLETLHVVESWIFCQGFSGNLMFKIPDSFCMLTPVPRATDVNAKKISTQQLRYIIPYMELLKHIASKIIAQEIGLTISCTDEEGLANELFCLYKRVLQFLKEMNAHLPHVEPELLLAYEQYVTYVTRIKNDRTKLSLPLNLHCEYNFYLLSKQAWLDVLLQTFKVFVVNRIKIPQTSTKRNSKAISLADHEITTPDLEGTNDLVSQKSIKFISKIDSKEFVCHHIFSPTENYLLNWMKYHYTCYINEICYDENLETMLEKQIDDYDSCLMDSLVLATVIVAHCPYLKNGLSGLYFKPASTEQFHHNAAVVIQALTFLNSTFELLPRNIYNPNNIQMILLAAYLYEFLPCLYPRNTITVISKLSTTSLIRVSIDNENNFDVNYRVLFFENDHRCFRESRNVLRVASKSTDYLEIRFHAKFIRTVSAVLILCGEVVGKKCAKSMAYRLIGEPDVTHVTGQFYIATKCYTSEENVLDIQAPYKGSGCYDLYLTYEQPTTCKDLKLVNCFSLIKDRILSKFNFCASQAFFNELGQSTLVLNCVALTGNKRSGWVFFRNPEIGDFCIYIEMQTLQTKEVEYIHVNIPQSVYNQKCVCIEKGSKYCKKFFIIEVPKINNLLLECFKREFIKLKGDNAEFWTCYLEKPTAVRHMRMSLTTDHCEDILRVLCCMTEKKCFDVTVADLNKTGISNQDVTFPKTLTIESAEYGNLGEFEPLCMHVGNRHVQNFLLQMYNKEMKELRKYKVIVNHL